MGWCPLERPGQRDGRLLRRRPGGGRERQPVRRGRLQNCGQQGRLVHRPLDRGGGPVHPRPRRLHVLRKQPPVTIVVPPGGQGDLARINIQRFDKSHPNASSSLQTGYYWQIEGLDASGGVASGYSVDLTFSAPGFTPDGDDQVCRYTGSGAAWDCAATSYTAQHDHPHRRHAAFRLGGGQGHERAYGNAYPYADGDRNTHGHRDRHTSPTSTPTATLSPTPTVRAQDCPVATPSPTPTPLPSAGAIAGTVWLDADGDGTRAADELGLVNVRIEVVQEDGAIRTATTNGDGGYRFAALPPGTHVVREIQPPWLRFSTTPDEVTIFLAAGDTLTIDFGDWNGRRTWLPLISALRVRWGTQT